MTRSESDMLILAGLTIVALGTRLYGLGQWDFNVDEYYTVYKADERYTTVNNPAYYALVLLSFKTFGISEWSARFPAMVLGVLAIPVFYYTWSSVFNRYVAFVGALFIIFSGWHLWYSQFARFYSGVFLFGSLSYFLYYKALKQDSVKYLAWGLVSNVVGISFHLTSVMVPASCALFSIIVWLSKGVHRDVYSRRIAAYHLMVCGLVGIALSPFLLRVLNAWQDMGIPWGYSPANVLLQITKYIQVTIAVSAGMGFIWMLRGEPMKGIFFALGIGLPVMALVAGSAFMSVRPDYMFYALPLVFVLTGYLCDQTRSVTENKTVASYAMAVVILASLLPEMVSHYTGRKSLDIREVVEFIDEAYQPGDRILPFIAGFDHYSKNKYPMERRPGSAFSNSVAWNDVLQSYAEDQQRLWIILPMRREPLAKGLEDWLRNNATLAWRKNAKRYDYTFKGYQIFLVKGS